MKSRYLGRGSKPKYLIPLSGQNGIVAKVVMAFYPAMENILKSAQPKNAVCLKISACSMYHWYLLYHVTSSR